MSTNYSKTIVSELGTNTQFLVTSSNIFNMDWEELKHFITDMEELNIPIKIIRGIQEWGQDFIKYVYDIEIGNTLSKQLNIVLRDSSNLITDSIKKEMDGCSIFIENANENTNLYNLQKGGNYCVLPNTITFNGIEKNVVKLDPDPESSFAKYSNCLCLKIYDPNFHLNNYYGDKVFHLDEIFTIIPTGFGADDYIIFFYNPICSDNEDFQKELQEIFQYNYEILKQAFGKEKIFLFDINFEKGSTFKTSFIVSPPLFNRLLIRKDDVYYIYFPTQSYINYTKLNKIMNDIINFFPDIRYKFINTSTLHNLGGNIHCAFKVV